MILGDAEHHEEFGPLPIRLAELPKAAADCIHPGGGHVDRAEPAMGGKVRSAELGRPIPGQGLALVAASEEGELLGVCSPDRRQPFDRGRDRILPLDLAELAGAALADPFERLGQLRRRLLLHDAGGALAADHATIYRMIAVAFDVADGAILEMNFDPAAAGAHIAGCAFDLV